MSEASNEFSLPFDSCKVLVVEDEYLIADDLAAMLRERGAEVVGPAYSLPMATRIAAIPSGSMVRCST